jgi:exonuclease III
METRLPINNGNTKNSSHINNRNNDFPERPVTKGNFDRNLPGMILGSLNVRTLRTEERLIELEEALAQTNVDIIGLAEVRRNTEKIIHRKSGFIFYHYGTSQGQRGVGFMVRDYLKSKIVEFNGISERIALLRLKIGSRILNIFQVYAPTSLAEEAERELFYDSLSKAINSKKTNWKEINIILGDFNSQVGCQEAGEKFVVGKYGYGVRNEAGQRLVDFCQEQGMKIINTFFKKRKGKKWTWISPNNLVKNEIDYVLAHNKGLIKQLEITGSLHFSTDHRLIKVELSKQYFKIRPRPLFKQQVSRLIKFRPNEMNKLEADLQLWNEQRETSIQESYDRLEQIVQGMFETETELNTKKISVETKRLIVQRETLKRKKNKSVNDKIELNLISKLVKYNIRKDLKTYEDNLIKAVLDANGSMKKLKQQLFDNKEWKIGVRDRSGRIERSRLGIVRKATSYYKELYASTVDEREQFVYDLTNEAHDILPMSMNELETASRTLRNNTMAGRDKITNEMLKALLLISRETVLSLFNRILTEQIVPSQWKQSDMILLFKKGDMFDMNNYRPISIASCFGKFFMKILQTRLQPILNQQQPVEQSGFRSGFSTLDHLQSINQLIQKCEEFQIGVYLAFVDYRKAFDSLDHQFLFTALQKQLVPTAYINIIKSFYNKSTARILLDNTGDSFYIQKGVKQGDPLSPMLFNAALEAIFRQLKWEKLGVCVEGTYLNNLRFADDIVLVAKSLQQMKVMISNLAEESKRAGLTMNPSKTFLMTNRRKEDVVLDGCLLKWSSETIYLGQLLSFTNRTEKEVKRRCAIAWKRFWSLKFILKNNYISAEKKIEVLRSCVFATLIYGSQTWACKETTLKKIRTTQMAMERSILNIRRTDRKRNTFIKSITQLEDLVKSIKTLKWKWAGHVIRIDNNRWTRKLTIWRPNWGQRKVGRQRVRWDDDIVKALGSSWTRYARDRSKWSNLGEAYAQ